MGYYQLCMVDRYWSRRYTDLCDSFIIQTGMENRRKPGCRSDDDFCSNVCRPVSNISHGTCMGRLLLYCLIQTSVVRFGLTLIHHYCGMYLRYQLILPFHYYSGTRVYCLIWQQFVTGQKQNSEKCFTDWPLLDGPEVPNTGNVMKVLLLVLAGLATPLVLSVHTIVSFDFATSVVPGWHTTIFPPYFVAGAIFSGFAMVQSLLIITRKVLHLEDYITVGHIEAMNKVIVLTGSIVGYCLSNRIVYCMVWPKSI